MPNVTGKSAILGRSGTRLGNFRLGQIVTLVGETGQHGDGGHPIDIGIRQAILDRKRREEEWLIVE